FSVGWAGPGGAGGRDGWWMREGSCARGNGNFPPSHLPPGGEGIAPSRIVWAGVNSGSGREKGEKTAEVGFAGLGAVFTDLEGFGDLDLSSTFGTIPAGEQLAMLVGDLRVARPT